MPNNQAQSLNESGQKSCPKVIITGENKTTLSENYSAQKT